VFIRRIIPEHHGFFPRGKRAETRASSEGTGATGRDQREWADGSARWGALARPLPVLRSVAEVLVRWGWRPLSEGVVVVGPRVEVLEDLVGRSGDVSPVIKREQLLIARRSAAELPCPAFRVLHVTCTNARRNGTENLVARRVFFRRWRQ